MKLSEILIKKNNNLDIFRLLAASLVVYGHAGAIAPGSNWTDFVIYLVGFDYSGSLAVKTFFFLSGLVVTNSLLHNSDIPRFIINRAFRIFPALIAVVFISAILIGPVVSSLPFHQYFADGTVYSYIGDNVIFKTAYILPGVFDDNPYPSAVNGSLWSLAYEVALYIGLLVLYFIGIFKSRIALFALFFLFLLDSLIGNQLLFTYRPANHEIDYLLPCFAIGVMFACFKESLSINVFSVVFFLVGFLYFKGTIIQAYCFYVFLFVSILYMASRSWLIRFKPSKDLSYGIYLWGFVIQQTMIYWFPGQGTATNALASLAATFVIAWGSWHFIEKPAVQLGYRLVESLRVRVN